MDNEKTLKNIFEEKLNEYDRHLIRIDKVKDKLFEIITNYNNKKEKLQRVYFSNILFSVCLIIFTFVMFFCYGLSNFNFTESISISFMTILLSCDGLIVISNNFVKKMLLKNVDLNMDSQTINQLQDHLANLLKKKDIIKNERDNAWINYIQNKSSEKLLICNEEKDINYFLDTNDSIKKNTNCKKLIKK